jgi:hypothetical protein
MAPQKWAFLCVCELLENTQFHPFLWHQVWTTAMQQAELTQTSTAQFLSHSPDECFSITF